MVTIRELQRFFDKLRIKIMLLMARGILRGVDNTKKTQSLKIECLKDEVLDNVERLQEFGFESYPPTDENTEVLTLFVNGTRDLGLVIKAHNRELRPTDVEEGGSCQYGQDTNGTATNKIKISPTKNTIEISTYDGHSIKVDEDGIAVSGPKIDMLAANEPFVKGDTAKVEMDKDQALMSSLQSAISAWVPVPNDGGAALKAALAGFLALPQASYASILSTKIKGE